MRCLINLFLSSQLFHYTFYLNIILTILKYRYHEKQGFTFKQIIFRMFLSYQHTFLESEIKTFKKIFIFILKHSISNPKSKACRNQKERNCMKKLSFSTLPILSFALFECAFITPSSQQNSTPVKFTKNRFSQIPQAPQALTTSLSTELTNRTPLRESNTAENEELQAALQSTSSTAPSSNAGVLATFWSGIFGTSELSKTTSSHSLTSDKVPTTLSGQLCEQTQRLLLLRRQQLLEEQTLRDNNYKVYQQFLTELSKTATTLGQNLDQFIPKVVSEAGEKLLTLRQEEEQTAIKNLITALAIVNQTKAERGKGRNVSREAGQTKANFRPETPTEKLSDFATRITKDSAKK